MGRQVCLLFCLYISIISQRMERKKNGKFDSGRTSPSACLFTICQRQIHTWTPQQVSAHLQPVLPQFTGSKPLCLCWKSRREEREKSPEKQGRRGGGGIRGTRSKAQEVGKDEEPRDNVMHRGDEPEERRRRRQKRNVGRGGGESRRRRAGCVHLALGGREKIAWARLAGRVCLCLIEEGCETQTPNTLGFTGTLLQRDRHTDACFTHNSICFLVSSP